MLLWLYLTKKLLSGSKELTDSAKQFRNSRNRKKIHRLNLVAQPRRSESLGSSEPKYPAPKKSRSKSTESFSSISDQSRILNIQEHGKSKSSIDGDDDNRRMMMARLGKAKLRKIFNQKFSFFVAMYYKHA